MNKIVQYDELTEPSGVRIASPQPVFSLNQIRETEPKMIFYATSTCWWTANANDLYKDSSTGLPCDPRGCTLLQTDNIEGFLKSAVENSDHYGKYGLTAFVLAYHGNIIKPDGSPTSFRRWDDYNQLLDEKEKE